MKTANILVSPVNMDERKKLGVRAGDTVRVTQKIVEKATKVKGKGKDKGEKKKIRLQVFDGLVLAVKHGSEAGGMFTVRKSIDGVGVERIFPLYSPMIDKIEIVRRANVRRAKLYHIREKAAKEIRRQMKSELHVSAPSEDSETLVVPEAVQAAAAADVVAKAEVKE